MSKRPRARKGRPPSGASPRVERVSTPRNWARWCFSAGLVLVVVAALAWWLWPASDAPLPLVRSGDQNVLLVSIDTLRADALASYGGRAATPNLDGLARDGMRYDFAHAHAVITLPSHTSIFTGQYPPAHGVRDNSGYRVPAGTTTLATILKDQGFATGAFIGGFPLDSQFGLDVGFDVYDDRVNEVRGPADFAESERPAGDVVASALRWLEDRRGQKWFAFVHLYDPHAPNKPPEPFARTYASDPYAGEVAYVDSALGPLLEKVRNLAGRPTLVLVTSDHGEGLGDHGEATHGIFAYEAVLRVPLMVAQYSNGHALSAGSPRPPRTTSAAVQHVDILPTVLDALQVPPPAGLPGRSLAGLTPGDARLRASYFEALAPSLNRGWAPLTGVMVDREKYIDLPIAELYDLARDPPEQDNLATRTADRRSVLETRLRQFGSTEAGPRTVEDVGTMARLQSLGYTSGRAQPKKVYSEDDDPKRLIQIDQEMQRSVALFNAGRLQEAADIYRAIIARRPDMGIAYLHLSFLQWELGRSADAIGTLRTAVSRSVPSAEIDWKLGMYLSETGALVEAIPMLERAVTRPDAGVDAFNALGIAYARAGQADRAMAVFRKILEIDVRNAMALQNMGSVHLASGNVAAARAAFLRAIEVNPGWAASHTGLGAAEIQLGHRDAAIAAWTRAVALDPQDFDALFNLGTELVNGGDMSAARPYLARFVQSAPKDRYGRDVARLAALLRLPAEPPRFP